jgi:NhaA family Na+:H+ antiporter
MAGVAIPAATDIAFALGVLSLLGSRVPLALKLLLTAIAVLDDLGAIVIIAVYYTDGLSQLALGVAGTALAGLVLANRAGLTRWSVYILLGVVMWVAVLKSGVHATLAGVALGMTIPIRDRRAPEHSPLAAMEHALHPWVAYFILPLFAFANAGVSLAGAGLATLLAPVPLGITLGLLVGKQVGVCAGAALLIGTGLARRPDGVSWTALWGMSLLCGIGFTMSLFIGGLAFHDDAEALQLGKQVGIFAGSLAAAVAGYAVLRLALSRRPA